MSASLSSATVVVVVLSWNGEEDTLACLESLQASDWPRLTTIVVDNGSEKPIEPAVAGRFSGTLVLRNETNLGFAAGMNVGLRHALELGADYVLLLNNDTIVDPALITRLVEAAQSRPDPGIVSPLVLYRDTPDLVASAGSHFDPRRGHPGRPLLADSPLRSSTAGVREVEASTGEAMLVSAAAARRVGGLDENLYVRLEDIDWSLRMRAAGLHNLVALDARLWHGVSQSSGGDHSAFTAYYHTRNILFVCGRHARMGLVRGLLREAEVLVANLAHARRGARPRENARAVLAGWRDYRRSRMGPRGAPS